MPTKKIRLLDPSLTITLQSPSKMTLQGGRVYELPKETAKKLIEDGLAAEVKDQGAEKHDENTNA